MCGTICRASVDAPAVMCYTSIEMGASGMLPRSYCSHCSVFGVLYKFSRRWTSWKRSSMAHGWHWIRDDGACVFLLCSGKRRCRASVLWPQINHGGSGVLVPLLSNVFCLVDHLGAASFLTGCASDFSGAHLPIFPQRKSISRRFKVCPLVSLRISQRVLYDLVEAAPHLQARDASWRPGANGLYAARVDHWAVLTGERCRMLCAVPYMHLLSQMDPKISDPLPVLSASPMFLIQT